MKVGGDVFVETLILLYIGEEPIEENLLKIAEIKSNGFNFDEKTFLTNLKEGKRDIKNMDISLSFKLIQLTCGLEQKQNFLNNSCVWSKRCPIEKQNNLEHLLYKYKLERNDLVHEFSSLGLISNEEFIERKNQNLKHIFDIVRKVGEKAELSSDEVESWIKRIETEVDKFCEQIGIVNDSPSVAMPKSGTSSMSEAQLRHTVNSTLRSISACQETQRMFSNQNFGVRNQQKFPENLSASLAVNNALLKAYAQTDVDQNRSKPLEKSNRLYWVDKLIKTPAQAMQTSTFWKDFGKSLDLGLLVYRNISHPTATGIREPGRTRYSSTRYSSTSTATHYQLSFHTASNSQSFFNMAPDHQSAFHTVSRSQSSFHTAPDYQSAFPITSHPTANYPSTPNCTSTETKCSEQHSTTTEAKCGEQHRTASETKCSEPNRTATEAKCTGAGEVGGNIPTSLLLPSDYQVEILSTSEESPILNTCFGLFLDFISFFMSSKIFKIIRNKPTSAGNSDF
ncbi:hypothetical protein Anas_08147 [Armadillidium nasatum]|uniref:DZIP3-like HEPN domain-containing protein n=1 Tax=Armadillidium nasatum TaxID=96803 RepID=A0A5N5SIZ4_9CRUS|nr:hypothetical protein Anas_08147 [Armadillidium nasatum]